MRRSKCLYSLRMDTVMRFSLSYISRFHLNILLYWSNGHQVTCFIYRVRGCLLILTVFSPPYPILTRTAQSALYCYIRIYVHQGKCNVINFYIPAIEEKTEGKI